MARVEVNSGAVEALYAEIAEKIKSALEPIARDYSGKPVDEVKPVVESALAQIGITGGDVAQTVAQQISAGQEVRVNLT
ncbi:hypothetical protein ACVDFE_07830 [Lentzea chajnantorensis]